MKKWFSIAGLFILIVLLGSIMITLHGHSQRNYHASIRLGQNDVIDRNYHNALDYFQGARRVDSSAHLAQNDVDQTQSYISGVHYFDRHQLTKAAKSYQRTIKIGSISALNHRSLINYKKINIIQKNSRRFTKLYTQALVLNHRHDFRSSINCLNQIMNNQNVKLKYFHKFELQVIKLIRFDRHSQRSNQIKLDIGNGHNSLDQFRLRPQVIIKYPSKITISRARHKIQQAGIDVHEMSNRDVINLIHQAIKHHSSIYWYAKRNY